MCGLLASFWNDWLHMRVGLAQYSRPERGNKGQRQFWTLSDATRQWSEPVTATTTTTTQLHDIIPVRGRQMLRLWSLPDRGHEARELEVAARWCSIECLAELSLTWLGAKSSHGATPRRTVQGSAVQPGISIVSGHRGSKVSTNSGEPRLLEAARPRTASLAFVRLVQWFYNLSHKANSFWRAYRLTCMSAYEYLQHMGILSRRSAEVVMWLISLVRDNPVTVSGGPTSREASQLVQKRRPRSHVWKPARCNTLCSSLGKPSRNLPIYSVGNIRRPRNHARSRDGSIQPQGVKYLHLAHLLGRLLSRPN